MAGPQVLVDHVQNALFNNDIAALRRYLNHPRFPDAQQYGESLGSTLWPFVIAQIDFHNKSRTAPLSIQGLDLLHQKVPFKTTFLGTFPFVAYLNQTSLEHLQWFQDHTQAIDSWGQLKQLVITLGMASMTPSFDANHFEWFKQVFNQYETICSGNAYAFQKIRDELFDDYFVYERYERKGLPFGGAEYPLPRAYLYALEKIQPDLKFPFDAFLKLSPIMTGRALVQLSDQGLIDLEALPWTELQEQSEQPEEVWMVARTAVDRHLLERNTPTRDEKPKSVRL